MDTHTKEFSEKYLEAYEYVTRILRNYENHEHDAKNNEFYTPNAYLVGYYNERQTLSLVKWASDSMHNEVGNDFMAYSADIDDKSLREDFIQLTNDGLGTPLEYVPTVWRITNVSRALQQQLTRYRVGVAFCIESLRVVDKRSFATYRHYHIPPRIKNDAALCENFHRSMMMIELMYNSLLDSGIQEEDARGILPLNVFSTITMSANFRTIMHIISTRRCFKAQGEFKLLAESMLREIADKMGKTVANSIKKPCEINNCLMIVENKKGIECVIKGDKPRRPICPFFVSWIKGNSNSGLSDIAKLYEERHDKSFEMN